MSYEHFLQAKAKMRDGSGFDPLSLPDCLFDFQVDLVNWACRMGRSAIFADCGLGKTLMQLAWADNVIRHTNGRVLILTPLAVSYQTVKEAEKFGYEAERCGDGTSKARMVVANYERLDHFHTDDFAGVVCDESSILKNFAGKTRQRITEFTRRTPYRLLCTATAAPNDFHELGTSSEALGLLGYTDMITQFFKEDVNKDYLGWGRKSYRFRGHAERPFWRWVCSWARSCRKPSDLGYDDRKFILPELVEREEIVENSTPREGMLFAIPAKDLLEQREERRVSMSERCEAAAALATGHDGASVIWCHLNDEGDELERSIPGAVQVKGSQRDEVKEERLLAFQSGQIETLVTKPKIGCFGLNWQHCHNVISFPSHSFEQYYQAVRRCWRFGQQHPVTVSLITTEGEQRVLANLRRKAQQASEMFTRLVEHMGEARRVDPDFQFNKRAEMPSWM